MAKMTKVGNHDNVLTYEHVCDTTADLNNIDPEYINLGSTAIVLHGSAGIEVYMADSNKTWVSLIATPAEDEEEEEEEQP